MNKPTNEQIEEFWEWCGWNWEVSPPNICELGSIRYYHLAGKESRFDGYPDVDLNNLFRWAVPKMDYAEINYDYRQSEVLGKGYKETHSDFIYSASVSLDVYDEKHADVENIDPALALFWAIYEVIKQ